MHEEKSFKKIEGNLALTYSEESGCLHWAVLDASPDRPVVYEEDRAYTLRNGDVLAVFNDVSLKPVWQGVIDLDFKKNTDRRGIQKIGRYAVAGLQHGVRDEEWMEMFIDRMRANLIRTTVTPVP